MRDDIVHTKCTFSLKFSSTEQKLKFNVVPLHFYSVHENLSKKSTFCCTMSTCTDFYPQGICLVETHHWGENVHILFLHIF